MKLDMRKYFLQYLERYAPSQIEKFSFHTMSAFACTTDSEGNNSWLVQSWARLAAFRHNKSCTAAVPYDEAVLVRG